MYSSKATLGKARALKLGAAVLLPALAFLLSGCDLIGLGQATPTPFVVPTRPRPTPTPTPLPTPTPSAEVTPTPTRNLDEAQVQQLVFRKVRPCADQLSAVREAPLQVIIETTYLPVSQLWQSKVTSKDGTLFFGTWRVQDSLDAKESEPRPTDIPAREIDAPNVVCAESASRLSPGSLWPVATTPTPTPPTAPTPTPTPTPISAIASAEAAKLRVWVEVYNCYNSLPKLADFTAFEEQPGRWIVEGIATNARYGIWRVDVSKDKPEPLDALAKQANAPCILPPGANLSLVVAGEQAELRVWIAVYDCFPAQAIKPQRSSFKVYVDSPQRWLVEGRGEEIIKVQVESTETGRIETFTEDRKTVVFYGLWSVDATSLKIEPWDDQARGISKQICYKPP